MLSVFNETLYRISDIIKNPNSNPVRYNPDEACGLLASCGLTEAQYIRLRVGAIEHNADIC